MNPALQEAIALFAAGRLPEAQRTCRKALRERPGLAEGHLLLAEIHQQSGDLARARESVARVLRLRPGWSEAQVQLARGDLLNDIGRYGDAEMRYRLALELQPGLVDARYNLASALYAAGRIEDAIAELEALLAREPDAADAREHLVRMLQEARRFAQMEAVCREGLARHARAPIFPHKLGVALWRLGRYDEALQAYRLAIEQADPDSKVFEDAKVGEASALLTLGRYREGWETYRSWRITRKRLLEWQPELIQDPAKILTLESPKRIRIFYGQGLGDELFSLRFAVPLRQRGHRLIVVCEEKLAPLLCAMPDIIDAVNPSSEEADFTVSSSDLPLASGEEFASPLVLPVDAARRAAFEARLQRFGPPPYVGVTWRSGVLPDEPKPQHGVAWVKDVPPELLAAALRPMDARVVVLQRRPPADELRRFAEALGRDVLDLSAANDDLRDALALLSLLDEYVGVGNTNMHLRAGVPGKSARVLVLTPAEWRWGLEGRESPWFPGFRLYRQASGGDWRGALAELREDLLSQSNAAMQQK